MKATHAFTEATQVLLTACHSNAYAERIKKELKVAVKKNTDALTILRHASTEIVAWHRQAIRPAFPQQLAGLCTGTVPASPHWLFGDNLSSSLKEVKELNRITSSAQLANKGARPYGAQSGYKKNFLGQNQRNWLRSNQYKGRGGSHSQRLHFGGKNQRPFSQKHRKCVTTGNHQ